MAPRTILVSVLALGLVGAGIYAAPCLMGPCEDQGSVVAGEAADEPCDTPCDPPCDDEAKGSKTLAAGGADEPCDTPCEGKDKALAAGGGDEPCPFANKAEPVEPHLAAQAEPRKDEPAPVAAVVPQT